MALSIRPTYQSPKPRARTPWRSLAVATILIAAVQDGRAQLFPNGDFETGTGAVCDCATGYTCQNDAGRVVDGIHPVWTIASQGCIGGTTNYTSPLGAHSGTGYMFFYAGLDQVNTPAYFFNGGEEVELCVWYSGPPAPATAGQNTAASHFKFGVDGVQVGPNVTVPAGTGWTQHCFTVTMTPGNHVFNIMSGNAAQYSIWFDDFTVTSMQMPPCPWEIVGDTVFCEGGDTFLEVISATGYDFIWSNGDVGPFAVISEPGIYTVEIFDDCGVTIGTVEVFEIPASEVFLGNDTTLCPGATLLLDASTPGSTYSWQDGSDQATYLVTEPGFYFVTVDNICGSFFSFIEVTYSDVVPLDLGPDLAICDNAAVVLDATVPGGTYLWSNGSTESTVLVDSSGPWWVDVTTGCGSASDTVNVELIPTDPPSFGNDTTLCTGETLLLDATMPGSSYTWQDGSTDPTYLVSSPDLYFVTINNACGSYFLIINVDYIVTPTVDLGPDQDICDGGFVYLDATVPGATYLWNNGSQDPDQVATTPGTWSVVVINSCGVATDEMELTLIPEPSIEFGPDTTICEGPGYVLDATTPGATYLWQDGSTAATFPVTEPGFYSVSVVNACGTSDDDITIGLIELPELELGNDTVLCPGDVLVLDASWPDATYVWSTGSDQPSLTVTQTGTYIVQLTYACGMLMDQVDVFYAASPVFSLGNDSTLCDGTSLPLDITIPTATYLWQDGSTSPTYTISTPGTYWATATTVCGTFTDSVEVEFIPIPTLDLGPDTTLCPGDLLTIDASTVSATYLWSTGSTSPSITVGQVGLYSVTVTVSCAVLNDTVDVYVLPVPEIDLPRDTLLCDQPYLLLDVTEEEAVYLWQDGSTEPTFLVEAAGPYNVEVTNRCGSDTHSIVVNSIDCSCVPYVPNAFTPNNDGINDFFHPVFACDLDNFELLIFNRWGELVYQTKDLFEGWDGVYGGALSQDEVYVWRIEYRTAEQVDGKLSGHVTLLK